MKIVFFSRPKNKQFDYKPRYYDIEKDKREQRKKELGLGSDEEGGKRKYFRGELQNRWRSNRKDEKDKTRRRTMIYLVMIFIVIYYIFFTDFVQQFVTNITNF